MKTSHYSLLRLIAFCLASAAAVPALAEDETFEIKRFRVEGNSLLSSQSVEETVTPFTGTKRNYGHVQRALEALELRYRQAGYGSVLVHVPEQELTQGEVRLQIIEPRLRLVNLNYVPPEGRDYFDPANVRSSLPALEEGATPNTPRIAENIHLANENAAKQVEVVLKAADDPGMIDADVNVQASNPKKFFLTFDNTGNEQTGKHRIGVGFQHANLFDRDHVATFNYGTSPEKPGQVKMLSVSYRLPLYRLGDSIDLIAARSDVDAGTTATVAGPLQFTGKGDVYGVHYNWLLPRQGEYSHRVVFGLDYRAFDNTCTLGSAGSAGCGPSAVDVTVQPFSVSYSGQWAAPRQVVEFTAALSRNLPGGNKGGDMAFAETRPAPSGGAGAPADFTSLRLGGSLTRVLDGDWQVRLGATAQYTPDPLIAAEQFGLAGSSTVRGFSERQASRDTGFVINVEGYSPNYASALNFGGNLRTVAFLDYANGRNNTLNGETPQPIELASTGVGLRLGDKALQARLDVAYVLQGASLRPKGDTRGHLSVYYAF